MSVTAKVMVSSQEVFVGGMAKVHLNADYENNKNAEWAVFTPTLTMTMMVNEKASYKFRPGTAFTLTFTKD